MEAHASPGRSSPSPSSRPPSSRCSPDRHHSPPYKRARIDVPDAPSSIPRKRKMKADAAMVAHSRSTQAVGRRNLESKFPPSPVQACRRRQSTTSRPASFKKEDRSSASSDSGPMSMFTFDRGHVRRPPYHLNSSLSSRNAAIREQNAMFREAFSFECPPSPGPPSSPIYELGAEKPFGADANGSSASSSKPPFPVTIQQSSASKSVHLMASSTSFDPEQAQLSCTEPLGPLHPSTIFRRLADRKRKKYALELKLGNVATHYLETLEEYVVVTAEAVTLERAIPLNDHLSLAEVTQFLSAFQDSEAAEIRSHNASDLVTPPCASSIPSGDEREMHEVGQGTSNEPGYFQRKIDGVWAKFNSFLEAAQWLTGPTPTNHT